MSKGYGNSLLKAEDDRRAGREPKPKAKVDSRSGSWGRTVRSSGDHDLGDRHRLVVAATTEEVKSPDTGSDTGSETATDAVLPVAGESATVKVETLTYSSFMSWLSDQSVYQQFVADENHVLKIKPYGEVTKGSDVKAGDYFLYRSPKTNNLYLFHQKPDVLLRWDADKKDFVRMMPLKEHTPILIVSREDAEAEFPKAFAEPEDAEGEE